MTDGVFADHEGSGLALRLGVATLFVAYANYVYIQRRQEYEVC